MNRTEKIHTSCPSDLVFVSDAIQPPAYHARQIKFVIRMADIVQQHHQMQTEVDRIGHLRPFETTWTRT